MTPEEIEELIRLFEALAADETSDAKRAAVLSCIKANPILRLVYTHGRQDGYKVIRP